MKKIFPIITILISLSLLGLIFFQIKWIESARNFKEQQLSENISRATADAAEKLMVEKNIIPSTRRNDLLFPAEKNSLEFFRHSVLQRFNKQEITEIVRLSLRKFLGKDVPFEFAIAQNSITGEEVRTENFIRYALDTVNNIQHVIPLVAASGGNLENLSSEEFLVVIVPNEDSLVLREIFWFIAGSILLSLIHI